MAPIEKKPFIQSWADELDDEVDLPPRHEAIKGKTLIVTEYKLEDGKKVKYVKHYKTEKVRQNREVLQRREWRKFGGARDDPPGPNPSNTVVCEDVQMQFLLSRDDEQLENARDLEQDPMSKLIASNSNIVKCRLCDMDHWTSKCPYKGQFEAKKDFPGLERLGGEPASTLSGSTLTGSAAGGSKYVPPSMREGGNKRGESLSMNKREDHTVRITNLPEEIQDSDIKELFKSIGEVSRIYLARDKITGQSKGFAFVSFRNRADAAKAIQIVNGYGYANLILNVEWAKPSNN